MKGGSGSGGGSKSKALQTNSDSLVKLRAALRTAKGEDKDVLAELGPFCKYERNGLDVVVQFATGRSCERSRIKQMAEMTKPDDLKVPRPRIGSGAALPKSASLSCVGTITLVAHAQPDASTGCVIARVAAYEQRGVASLMSCALLLFLLQEKIDDFKDPSARFFVVTARSDGALVGFVHARFTLQGEARALTGAPAASLVQLTTCVVALCVAHQRSTLRPSAPLHRAGG